MLTISILDHESSENSPSKVIISRFNYLSLGGIYVNIGEILPPENEKKKKKIDVKSIHSSQSSESKTMAKNFKSLKVHTRI